MSTKIWVGYGNFPTAMKSIRFIIILSLVLMAGPALALEALAPDTLAQRVQEAYEKTKDLQMDFSQKTYVALLEEEVKKQGRAQFKKPGKFRIQYLGKRGKTYLSDGKTLWIYRPGDKQIRKFPVTDDTVPSEALSFLGGFGQLKRDFAVETVDPKKIKRLKIDLKKYQWLELTPLKKQSQIDWLVVGFDPKDFLVRVLYFYTDSGNLSQYHFSQIKPNEGLPDEFFVYKGKKQS